MSYNPDGFYAYLCHLKQILTTRMVVNRKEEMTDEEKKDTGSVARTGDDSGDEPGGECGKCIICCR